MYEYLFSFQNFFLIYAYLPCSLFLRSLFCPALLANSAENEGGDCSGRCEDNVGRIGETGGVGWDI